MAQNQNTSVFPDTTIEEEVVQRPIEGPVDTILNLDKSQDVVKFGKSPGQVIVNPLLTEKVFNYSEYFDENFFKENPNIDAMLLPNNEATSFDKNMSYQDKIDLFNDLQPKFFYSYSDTEKEPDGKRKLTGIFDIDQRIDVILRSNIEDKIQAEMKRGVTPPLVPNPFTDAPAIFSTEYYARDEKTGKLLPQYSESPGRRAREFLKFLDKSFPKMGAKTKASLVNRNIYGRDDLQFKVPEEQETGTAGSGLVLGEKVVTLATDIPRAMTDLVISAIGAGGEAAYDGFKNLFNAATRTSTFKDQYQLLYKGKGWYFPNIFSEKGRDLIRSFLGPDAAAVYQKRLAKNGILVSQDQAGKILHYTSDTDDAIKLLSPILVGEAAVLANITKKSARKLFEQDFKLYQANNQKLKGPELVQSFLESRKSKFPIYSQIKAFLTKNKLKEGADLAESSKPVELRSMVIEAKDRASSLRSQLAQALKLKRKEFQDLDPAAKAVMTPLLKKEYYKTDEIIKLRLQLQEANMFVRMAEQTSDVPKYMRDMYRDSTFFATVAAVTAQQLNTSFNVDPQIGYLAGMGTVMAANFTRNSNILGMRSYLNAKTYSPTSIFKMLDKQGAFAEDLSSQDILRLIREPQLEGINPSTGKKFTSGERRMAKDLAQRINSLTPELRDQVVANIVYYRNMRNELATMGIDKDLLDTSFADMSGLAFFDALEDSFYYSVGQSKAFDKETGQIFLNLQNSRTKLQQSLEGQLNKILKTENVDKNNPAIIKFTNKISEALSNTKIRSDELRAIAETYVQSKSQLLQAYLHGHDIKGVQDAIKAEYGDVMEMADSLLDDAFKLSLIGDAKDVVKLKQTLNLIEEGIQKEFTATIANHRNLIQKRTKNIPTVEEVELAKYNDENASLARLAVLSRKLAKARARLPFQEFDQKYGNMFGTDASELGIKIIDDLKKGTDRSTKKLASQTMLSGDEQKLFEVLDSGAGKTIDKIIQETGDVDFRKNYIDEIRNKFNIDGKVKISDLDIVDYAIRTDNLSIGIALNMDETLRLYSALNAKAYKAYRSGTKEGIAMSKTYGDYAAEADALFDKVIDAKGVPISDDALKTINNELIQMRLTYQNEYTTPYLTKGTNVARWTNPESGTTVRRKGEIVAVEDNAMTPGGKKWGSGNEPNTWFDLQKISKMSDGDIVNKRADFLQTFGKWDKNLKTYVIAPNSEMFKALKEISSIKFERELRRLQQTISDPQELRDSIDILRKNTEAIFRSSNLENASVMFDYNEVMDIATELGSRIQRNANLKAAFKKEFIDSGLKKSLRDDAGRVYTALRKNQEKIKLLQDTGGVRDGGAFFEKFISTPNGLNELNELKKAVTSGKTPRMTVEEFDTFVKEIVSTHISRTVIKPTGTTTIIPVTADDGSVTYKAVKDTTMDTDALTNFLEGENSDVLISNLKKSGYIDDDHLNNLKRINTFMSNRKRQLKGRGDDIRITGQPRGLSIESYISRFYSISRQVVSPKYVATEALIQNIRMSDHRFLKDMITNPKVANIMAELIVDGKKFTEEKELRLKEILTVMAANALASGAMKTEDEIKAGQKLPVYDFSKFKQQ